VYDSLRLALSALVDHAHPVSADVAAAFRQWRI